MAQTCTASSASPRFASGGGRVKEPGFEPLALQAERFSSAGRDHFPAEPSQRPPRQHHQYQDGRMAPPIHCARRHCGIISRGERRGQIGPRAVITIGPFLQADERIPSMVERRIELGRRYHRKKKIPKLKRKLEAAKTDGDREKNPAQDSRTGWRSAVSGDAATRVFEKA